MYKLSSSLNSQYRPQFFYKTSKTTQVACSAKHEVMFWNLKVWYMVSCGHEEGAEDSALTRKENQVMFRWGRWVQPMGWEVPEIDWRPPPLSSFRIHAAMAFALSHSLFNMWNIACVQKFKNRKKYFIAHCLMSLITCTLLWNIKKKILRDMSQ